MLWMTHALSHHKEHLQGKSKGGTPDVPIMAVGSSGEHSSCTEPWSHVRATQMSCPQGWPNGLIPATLIVHVDGNTSPVHHAQPAAPGHSPQAAAYICAGEAQEGAGGASHSTSVPEAREPREPLHQQKLTNKKD